MREGTTATQYGGIPAFTTPKRPDLPFFAGLMVRAGWADETLRTCGLTHLVEHLALPARHLPELELNGVVQDSTTLFWFSGEREAALEQLVETTRALRRLPLERLESERSILFTEQESRSTALVPMLKSLRYGARGYGLSHFDENALRWVTPGDVADWAARYFTRANACLYVVGDLPEGLDLELPEGERHAPPRPEPIDYVRYPASFRHGPPATVGASFVGRRSVQLLAALRILEVRLRDTLRHQHGVTYSSDWLYEPLTGDEAHVVIWADAMETNVDRVRNVFLTVLDELAFAGPTDEELARDISRFREQLTDPLAAPSVVYKCAEDELMRGGQTSEEELAAELEASTSRDLADALSEALESMLLALPHDAAVVGGRFHEYPLDPPVRVEGRRVRRRRSLRRRGPDSPERELIVGREGLTLVADSFSSTVRYADCVGVLADEEGARGLWSADGFYIFVDPALWKGGRELVAEIDAAIPRELVIPAEGPPGDPDLAAGHAAMSEERWADAIDAYRRGLDRDDANALGWTMLAFAYEQEQRYPEMLEAAERAVETDGNLPAAHRALARAYRYRARSAEAEESIRAALRLDPSDLEVLADYAWLVGEYGDPDDALRAASRAVELYPDAAAAWFALGAAAEARGESEREEEALRKMIELEPEVGMWHNNLGWFHLRGGRYKDALACFDRALKRDRQNPKAARNRVVALALLGRDEESRRALQALRADDLRTVDDALARDENDHDSRSSRAKLLAELDRVEEALDEVGELEERVRGSTRADLLFDAAALRLDLGQDAQARELFDEAFASNPDSAEACYYRAYVGAHYDEPETAADGARRMLELYPTQAFTSDAAGYAELAQGRPQEAKLRFEETLRRQPLRCCSHAWRGIAASDLDDAATSAEMLDRARTLCMRGGVHCVSVRRLAERVGESS